MSKKIVIFLGLSLAMAYAEDASVGVSTSHMYKVNASTDILGRHNSKVANTPKTFVATPKKNTALMRSFNENVVIEPSSGRYEKYKIDKTYYEKYWFNDIEMDSATYVLNAALYDARFANTINFKGRSYVNLTYNPAGYTFSSAPNAYYGQEKYIQDNDNGSREYFYNINTLIRDNGLYSGAIAKREMGQGIGVYVAEDAQPNSDEAVFRPTYSCYSLPGLPNSAINHASKVTKIINHLAKEATVYTIDRHCLDVPHDVYPTRPDLYSPDPIYIGNHSYGTGRLNYYDEKAEFVDDYVYNTRVIEVASAGNAAKVPNNNISETGKGMNVITVGAANKLESGEYEYDDNTSFKNPGLQQYIYYDKPEIINMANVFFNKGATYTYNYKKTQSFPPTFGETSSATPYTVGMIADLLHQKPFYKRHPEVVKALLLTSSVMPLASSTNQQNDIKGNHNKLIGRGMPLYSAMIDGNRSRYWLGNKGDYFVNDKIVFEEPHITPGNTYRIAIAWLVEGKYLYENKDIAQDFDLRVSQVGNDEAASTKAYNPFEMVEYTAKNDNNLTITIERFHNHGNNRVMLGYNLYEVPKNLQSYR